MTKGELSKKRLLRRQALQKDGIEKEKLEDMAGLCLAIYEGNLVLYRLSKDQSLLARMNAQLRKVIRGER